jgi:hypothetical protein
VVRGPRGELADLAAAVAAPAVVLEEAPRAETVPLRVPRIALVETAFHDMDAGWTRYLFDQYHLPYTVLRPGDVADAGLGERFDVVVFPSADEEVLTKGKRRRGDSYYGGDLPPEQRQPLGRKGLRGLADFLVGGGVVVAWGESTGVFLGGLPEPGAEEEDTDEGGRESMEPPVRDISEQATKGGLYVPGAWLRAAVLQDHPVTWGMPANAGVFSRGTPVFQSSIPRLDTDRRVLVTHPEDHVLASGYIEGADEIANRAVGVWVRKAAGQLVLFGFRPQHRASTPATYKLLFNALLLPRLDPGTPAAR